VRARCALLLAVVAVVAGLVAMHGLGSAAVGPARDHAMAAGGHMASAAGEPSHACGHLGEGDGGGHAVHADDTCAAGGVGGGPALPVPLPGVDAPAVDQSAAPRPPPAALAGRSPPSLSELQLLRI
jgi:uncharacterized protein DUF6153